MRLGGLVSGMDTQTIVEQLMSIERQPVRLMTQRQTQIKNRQSTFQEINTRLNSLLTKTQNLTKVATNKVEFGDTNKISARIEGNANVGTYRLEIIQLAEFDEDGNTTQQAIYKVDGQEFQSDTNRINVEGVTVTLRQATVADEVISIRVDKNLEGVKKEIEEFVKQYNATMTFLNDTTSRVEGTPTSHKGRLQGDTTVNRMIAQIRRAMGETAGNSNEFSILKQIGIDSDRAGNLTINDAKLQEALEDNFDDVLKLFNHSENPLTSRSGMDSMSANDGFAAKIQRMMYTYGTSSSSVISTRLESLSGQIKSIDRQIDNYEFRLEKREARLYKQFSAMEQMLSSMQNQSMWLNSQLAQMGNMYQR